MKKLILFFCSLCQLPLWGGNTFFDVASSRPEHYHELWKSGASWQVRNNAVRLKIPAVKHYNQNPGIALRPQTGEYFNLAGYSVIAVDVKNLNSFPVSLMIEACKAGNYKWGRDYFAYSGIGLEPGEKATMRLRYHRNNPRKESWAPEGLQINFDGFNGFEQHVNPAQVNEIRFYSRRPERTCLFELSNFRLEEPASPLPAALKTPQSFYPCIDRFGQYKHAQWPRKLQNESEFARYAATERKELNAHPETADRTVYFGWKSGPSYRATGHFYPAKHDGKWFLIDPTGKLFWSFGMDCINLFDHRTGLALREHYFEQLPERSGVTEWCYSTGYALGRWYKEKGLSTFPAFNFVRWNLLRKHGFSEEAAVSGFLKDASRRLKSWGFNTAGNWSDKRFLAQKKIPYVVPLEPQTPTIPNVPGRSKSFPDVYHRDFARALASLMKKEYEFTFDDPWCIGYFVHNELAWGDETSLARGVLRASAGQPAKLAFRDMLAKKYGSIDKLNQAWQSNYSSWEAFLASTATPAGQGAQQDLMQFNHQIVEKYFSTIRDTLKQTAPHKLYLGCRFAADYADPIVKSAARYVDVLSYNLYQYSVGTFRLPEGVDKPVVIGEWHFGTLQAGPPSPGLCSTSSQQDRARAFDRYVRSALWNPFIVGAHYFAYYDQMATGRPTDCENMQFGFLSVVDVPYPEMIEVSRNMSKELYSLRTQK